MSESTKMLKVLDAVVDDLLAVLTAEYGKCEVQILIRFGESCSDEPSAESNRIVWR